MEGCFINKKREATRIDADRYLTSYRKMNAILRSSRTFKRANGTCDALDEATVHSQMYAVRAMILSVGDTSQRYFLYNYYIKCGTVESCARLLGISLRSAYRLKGRALESVAELMREGRS